MDRIIKGVIFKDYVRMMKNAKDVNWDKYLEDEDRKYLKLRISNSAWYPFTTFERFAVAIVKELASEDMGLIQAWGREFMGRLAQTDRTLVVRGNPMESLMRFKIFRGSLFNFDPIKVLYVTPNDARLELNYGMGEVGEKSAAYHTLGYLEKILELAGAREVKLEIASKVWEGGDATVIDIHWSDAAVPARRVRGTIFVDYVRMMRSRKDIDWNKHLQPEDIPYLDERIIDGEWYPMETFERMGIAIMNEIAGGKIEPVRLWGREATKSLLKQHDDLLRQNDPMESIMRFHILRASLFDYDPINIVTISPYHVIFEIDYGMSYVAEKAATYQSLGYFEMLLNLAGAKRIRFSFHKKKWEKHSETILELAWE